MVLCDLTFFTSDTSIMHYPIDVPTWPHPLVVVLFSALVAMPWPQGASCGFQIPASWWVFFFSIIQKD